MSKIKYDDKFLFPSTWVVWKLLEDECAAKFGTADIIEKKGNGIDSSLTSSNKDELENLVFPFPAAK